jgi:amidase
VTTAGRLADGSITSAALVRRSLERIDRLDAYFGAILATSPDALAQAEASDEHRRRRGRRSPLEGVPVVLKDNIDLVGMATTAGSLALTSSRPPVDAHLVGRLKQAGAVLVAKANLSELANFLTAGMPSGYSSLGGQVLNPYDTSVTPSGSSSGSAASVALGLAPLAVGSETDGSIISPAAHQSVVGIKPTLGLVSRQGVFPIAPSQDTAGPLAATVADAALLLGWMSGTDPSDPATGPADAVAEALRRFEPDPAELASATLVAVSEAGPDGGPRPGLSDLLLDALGQHGAKVATAGLRGRPEDDEMAVLHYEFAPAVTAYFQGWPARDASVTGRDPGLECLPWRARPQVRPESCGGCPVGGSPGRGGELPPGPPARPRRGGLRSGRGAGSGGQPAVPV